MSTELEKLQRDFLAVMREHYGLVYLWQLRNIYETLVSEVYASAIDKLVVIRSADDSKQAAFERAVEFIL